MVSKSTKLNVWDKAKKIRGKDPEKYRKDPAGNTMFFDSHGKSSGMGWDVDHIKPKSRGGSDSTRNLQSLNSGLNRSKGDSLVKKSRHSKANK